MSDGDGGIGHEKKSKGEVKVDVLHKTGCDLIKVQRSEDDDDDDDDLPGCRRAVRNIDPPYKDTNRYSTSFIEALC